MKAKNIDRAATRAATQLDEVRQAISVLQAEIDRSYASPEFKLLEDGLRLKSLSFAVSELVKRGKVIMNRLARLTEECELQRTGNN